MTLLRSALIGANRRRADGHAAAYPLVHHARLSGVSARTDGAAEDFARRWRVPEHFTDHRRMLERLRPDVVHVNVPPSARRHVLQDCAQAGVSGIVLEKPIGLDTADLLWLEDFHAHTSMRIVVNHQLHFHESRRRMAERLASGALGALRLVTGSARHLLGYQGTHVLEGMLDLAGSQADWVVASAWGAGSLADPGGHASPDNLVARLGLGTIAGEFRCGLEAAPEVADPRATARHHHKRLVAVGDRGRAEWTMWGTRLRIDGTETIERLDYDREDTAAQARLVDALCAWLLGGAEPSVSLAHSIAQFRVVLAMYGSAHQMRAVDPQDSPEADLLRLLEADLDAQRGTTEPPTTPPPGSRLQR